MRHVERSRAVHTYRRQHGLPMGSDAQMVGKHSVGDLTLHEWGIFLCEMSMGFCVGDFLERGDIFYKGNCPGGYLYPHAGLQVCTCHSYNLGYPG